MTLGNTIAKLFAVVLNCGLAEVAQVIVHPQQRGFMKGRRIHQVLFTRTQCTRIWEGSRCPGVPWPLHPATIGNSSRDHFELRHLLVAAAQNSRPILFLLDRYLSWTIVLRRCY